MHFRMTALRGWVAGCLATLAVSIASGQTSAEAPRPAGLRIIVATTSAQGQEVLDQLKQGKDFADIAKAISADPTGAGGGYMGRPNPAELCPELKDALKGLASGQVTGLVGVPGGYAILKVLPDSEVPPENPNSAPLPA